MIFVNHVNVKNRRNIREGYEVSNVDLVEGTEGKYRSCFPFLNRRFAQKDRSNFILVYST